MESYEFIQTLSSQKRRFSGSLVVAACGTYWTINVSTQNSVIVKCHNESKNYKFQIHVVVYDKPRHNEYIMQGKIFKHLFSENETAEFITGSLYRKLWEIHFYKCKEENLNADATSVARELPNLEHTENALASCSAVCPGDNKTEQDPLAITTATLDEFSSDLSSLLQTGLFSDIELHCDGEPDRDTGGSEVFKVHKAILAARSPVFAAMLQSPMKEAKDNVVDVKNCRPVVLQKVLEYIYSGKIQQIDDWSIACDILSVADVYQIPGLKRNCSKYLCSAATEDNALSLLAYGDLYDTDLKENLIRFVCDKFDTIKITKEWEMLRKEKPSLAMDVMTEKIQCLSSA